MRILRNFISEHSTHPLEQAAGLENCFLPVIMAWIAPPPHFFLSVFIPILTSHWYLQTGAFFRGHLTSAEIPIPKNSAGPLPWVTYIVQQFSFIHPKPPLWTKTKTKKTANPHSPPPSRKQILDRKFHYQTFEKNIKRYLLSWTQG